MIQLRENRGGRPSRFNHSFYTQGGSSRYGPVSVAIDLMQQTGQPVQINAYLVDRRRMRASIVTTARRRGMRVRTEWRRHYGPVLGEPRGRMIVTEVTL